MYIKDYVLSIPYEIDTRRMPKTPLMIWQSWFSWWLGAFGQHAISRDYVHLDLWQYMASSGAP